ncbi:hypothetical protein V502_03323 [Pseudogymnoascus sp. VKM F-4520 (FW-2644)]|nr:hypothetical protein V502_03323 [Pseudogymnoascus sp. VKM F-4520 (FW-2644)]
MGCQDVLTRKTGVIVGDDVLKLFNYAQEHKFAIPAINVTSSSTVVAALEAARDQKAPVILQMSQGGAAYFAGKGVANGKQEASIAGGIAGAHYIRAVAPAYGIPVILHTDHCAKKLLPWLDGLLDADEAYFKKEGEPLFSSHMIDLSEESVEYNIATTAAYLKRAAPMKQWLEMEIGITGGEEDGVNNEDVDNNSLYTQPEDILAIYQALSPISPFFSIAAGFGNVHGVYKPGNVKLHPELLGKHQKYVKDAIGAKEDKPVFLVFHGGSGSAKKEFVDAISYGVVKVNLDTDLQYAYLTGIRDYVLSKKEYIMKQVGNPDGEDKPNKKYFDPRVWVREGEKTMSARLTEGLIDFNTSNQFPTAFFVFVKSPEMVTGCLVAKGRDTFNHKPRKPRKPRPNRPLLRHGLPNKSNPGLLKQLFDAASCYYGPNLRSPVPRWRPAENGSGVQATTHWTDGPRNDVLSGGRTQSSEAAHHRIAMAESEGGGVPPAQKQGWTSFLKSMSSFSGDLSSLTAPPFILSSTSLTEFSSYWAEHPSIFVAPAAEKDPQKRALLVLKWFLSTLKQQYASRSDKYGNEKKPLNPFLGELFLGKWVDAAGTTELVSEQVSHHPPVTAYSIYNKEKGVHLQGYNAQKASFSRTINVKQIGHAIFSIPAYDETYLITLPNLHIEGLIFGAPFVELNDKTYITSSSGFTAKIDYSGRGWVSGKKNSFTATLYPTGKESSILYTITGQWNKTFEVREGKKGAVIDDYDAEASAPTPLTIAPLEEQDPMESRRAWSKVAAGIAAGDMDATGVEKSKIENEQRALRAKEKEEGSEWARRYFTRVESDKLLEALAPKIGLLVEDDKTGGIWRFDEKKAAAEAGKKN